MLKLAPPRARPESERAALAHWDGRGAVQLLNPADAQGDTHGDCCWSACCPDLSVRSLPEAKALLEAAGTLRRLWVEPPATHVFETVAERTGRQAEAMRAAASAGTEVAPLVDAALAAREELLAGPPEERLLHGTFRQQQRCSPVSACPGWPWARTRWSASAPSTWPGWSGTGWRT